MNWRRRSDKVAKIAIISMLMSVFTTLSPIVGSQPAHSSALYAFTSHTFTNCGKTGREGPTTANCTGSYATTWDANSSYFSVSAGVQQWKVPITGTYRIQVVGAHGAASTGASNTRGGRSAVITVEKDLTAGEIAYILVGQAGLADTNNGGGGGASFFSLGSRTATSGLVVAGGGGGTRTQATANGGDARTDTSGNTPNTHNDGANTNFSANTSLVNGYVPHANSIRTNAAKTEAGYGGLAGSNNFGDGGAGWFEDGYDDGTDSTGAQKLSGTAVGGGASTDTGSGGFGGGGSGKGSNGGGGGGGYTGGNGAFVAGGGGSFIAAGYTEISKAIDSSRSFTRGGAAVHGFVTVELLAGVPDQIVVTSTAPFTEGQFVGGVWQTSTPSGTARISASAVLSQLAVGSAQLEAKSGSVTFETNLISVHANDLVVKATTEIVISQSVEVDVGSGDLTLWSDSLNAGGSNGDIHLASGSVLRSSGGGITLGGGANPASDYATGRYGIYLEGATIDAGSSGDVYLRGQSVTNQEFSIGVNLHTGSFIQGRTVTILGNGSNSSSASRSQGVQVRGSTISASASLTMTGASGTSSTGNDHWGLYLDSSTISALSASITGTGGASTGTGAVGIRLNNSSIDTAGSSLNLTGNAGANGAGNVAGIYSTGVNRIGANSSVPWITARGKSSGKYGYFHSGDVLGGSGNPTLIVVATNGISSSGEALTFDTNGSVRVEGVTGGFVDPLRTSLLHFAQTPTDLTLGADAGVLGIEVDSDLGASGNLMVEAQSITVSSSISGVVGDIVLKARSQIISSQNVSLQTQGGDIVFWADSDSTNDGKVALNTNSSLDSSGGDIYIAGGGSSNGLPSGSVTGNDRNSVIGFSTGYSLRSGGGDIIIRGSSLLRRAVVFQNQGLIDSGTGKISISGIATGSESYGFGTYFALASGTHEVVSAYPGPGAIEISGQISTGTSAYSAGLGSYGQTLSAGVHAISISAIAAGGSIGLSGIASVAGIGNLQCNGASAGVLLSSARIATIDGDIKIYSSRQAEAGTYALQFDHCRGSVGNQGNTSAIEAGGSGSVLIEADTISYSGKVTLAADTVTISPVSSGFTSGLTIPASWDLLARTNLFVGATGNTAAISIATPISASNKVELLGGAISATSIKASKLAVKSNSTISLNGSNEISQIELQTTKASPTAADIDFNNSLDYLATDLSANVTGAYGVPKTLAFATAPATATEFTPFEISAKLTKDSYGFDLQPNNRTPTSFSLTKASGTGTLTGTTTGSVLGSDVHTFSDLVIAGVPGQGSSISFTVAGAGLTSTTSALIHFFNLPSQDATLSGLGVGSGSLTPTFGAATRSYQVTVPGGTASITFIPTANDSGHQQIEIIYTGGTAIVTSGQASSALTLTYGLNTFAIEVTAENGSTSSYTVTVYRQLSQQVDWDYSNVSITQPNGSISTASAFTDIYGDSRTSALSDDVTLDEDGLPVQTITLRVGEVLYLPMTSNYGNSLGYGGISGSENHICKILSFTRASDSRSGAYRIQAMKAGTCTGAFVTSYQRSVMVAMLSLGARGVEWPGNYFRTPYVNIVVERVEQTEAAVYNGPSSDSSTAVWNQQQTLEIQSSGRLALGDKSYTKVSGPCTVTTLPYVLGGRNYFFMATAQVVASGTGNCVVEGRQEADSIFEAKTWSHTIAFTKATQTLTFTSNVPNEPVVGSTYTPAATSSAMLPVTFAITTGNGTVCSINGSGVVSFATTGSCTIQAVQAGDGNYLAATPITQTLVVGTANQSINFAQIPDKEVGDVAFRALANASSGLPVTFTTNTSNTICTVSSAGLVTIIGEGQCAVTANQAGNSEVTAAQSVTRNFTIRPEGSSAPFITAVSYGDGTLTATLIAPSYTGGLSILDYSLFAYNSSNQNVALATSCNAGATPIQCSITGLNNGEAYTLKAAARTAAGLGNLSAASRAVTPLSNPQAVNALTALADNQTLTITWQPPSSLGGGDFARYDIRIRPSGGNFPGLTTPSATISSITASSYVFTGLQNGVSYDVEMITITTQPASNMNSTTLQSHTARVIQTPFTRPNAPRNLAAFEVDNAVKIAFAYPDFDGGRQVSEYRVSVNGTTVCTPTQIQVCSVPLSTLTSLLSSPFVGGIGFQQQPGSLGFLSTTTQIPITVVAVNDGGTSDPATTTYNLITGSSTPPVGSASSGSIGTISNLPTITSYSKQVLQSSGDSFSITGTNFALITEIWASNTKLAFLRTSETQIRITTPELSPGKHPLILRGSFGVVTVQDAISVIQGRSVTENTRITREFVDGFVGRSTYLGSRNIAKLRGFVEKVAEGSVIKCYGSIPNKAKLSDIRLAFKRADRVCDFVQSLNPNIEVVRTWVWKDGDDAWDRAQVRLKLFEN